MRYKDEAGSGSGSSGEELEDTPMVQKKKPSKPFPKNDRKHLIRPSSPFVGMNKKPYKPKPMQKPLKPNSTISKNNSPMPKTNNAPLKPKAKATKQESSDVNNLQQFPIPSSITIVGLR